MAAMPTHTNVRSVMAMSVRRSQAPSSATCTPKARNTSAVATAMALTGSSLNIAPILLFAQIRGDVLGNPHLGYALAFGMIVVTGIANTIYIWLRARSERWLK